MLYDALLAWCEAKGVTLQEAARDMGLHERTLYSWKKSIPQRNVQKKLLEYFHLQEEELRLALADQPKHKAVHKPRTWQVIVRARDGTPLVELVLEHRTGEKHGPDASLTEISRTYLASEDRIAQQKALAISAATPEASRIWKQTHEGIT